MTLCWILAVTTISAVSACKSKVKPRILVKRENFGEKKRILVKKDYSGEKKRILVKSSTGEKMT